MTEESEIQTKGELAQQTIFAQTSEEQISKIDENTQLTSDTKDRTDEVLKLLKTIDQRLKKIEKQLK